MSIIKPVPAPAPPASPNVVVAPPVHETDPGGGQPDQPQDNLGISNEVQPLRFEPVAAYPDPVTMVDAMAECFQLKAQEINNHQKKSADPEGRTELDEARAFSTMSPLGQLSARESSQERERKPQSAVLNPGARPGTRQMATQAIQPIRLGQGLDSPNKDGKRPFPGSEEAVARPRRRRHSRSEEDPPKPR